jgi:hypothetical protein
MASGKQRYEKIWMDSRGKLRDAWGRFIKDWQEVEAYETNIKESDKIVSMSELRNLLKTNVCEIVFVRRRPERAPFRPEIRRMLCTNALTVLTHPNAQLYDLRFHFPKTSRRLDERKHDIVVVWDLLMRDYRNVSISTPESPFTDLGDSNNTCHLRQTIPADDTFWKYYKNIIVNLNDAQKLNFMDSVG